MIDVVDGVWDEDAWWSTSNMGEAVPGVLTPLNWTFWGASSEHALRRAFVAFGALERKYEAVPESDTQRIMGVFHGRLAAKVGFLGAMGDRLPGTTGAAVAEQILGALPDDFVSRNTKRRLGIIAARLPVAAIRAPGNIRRIRTETAAWWTHAVRDEADPRARFADCITRFDDAMAAHIRCVFAGVQPMYDQVHRLAAQVGDPGLADRVLAGQGMHAELEMVQDIWELSRGRIDLATFLRRHGYHGPNEGEIASHVWREDPGPVERLARGYAERPDDEAPTAIAGQRAAQRRSAERDLLAELRGPRRQAAKLILRQAGKYVPLRGVGKVAYLQVLDGARAAARRIGAELAQAHSIDDPDDVAFLTADEVLTTAPGTPLQHLVEARRSRHAEHEAVVLPPSWRGRPEVRAATTAEKDRKGLTLTGISACSGLVEARARIVLDPTFADVAPGEILVAPFTDPSWASIMFTSAALVVDIGGALSHAAVVARELGLPCVMGTGDGTRRIADGDLIRVDGSAGVVEILETAAPPAEPPVR